jgi:hypothetical protein
VTLPLPTKRMLSDAEAANYCGVAVGTLKSHVPVAPVKIGARVLYDVKRLDNWLDNQSKSEPMTGDDWLGLLDEGDGEGN